MTHSESIDQFTHQLTSIEFPTESIQVLDGILLLLGVQIIYRTKTSTGNEIVVFKYKIFMHGIIQEMKVLIDNQLKLRETQSSIQSPYERKRILRNRLLNHKDNESDSQYLIH